MFIVDRLAQKFRGLVRAEVGMRRAVLVIVVALATFTAALVGAFLHATRTADEAIRDSERQLLENHLDVTLRGLLETQAIQLSGDEGLRKVGQGPAIDAAWADANLGGFLGDTVDASAMYLVDPDGRLLRAWAQRRPAPAAHYQALAAEVRRVVPLLDTPAGLSGPVRTYRQSGALRWAFGGDGRPLRRWQGRIVQHDGHPALMTVIALLPDHDYRLLRQAPNLLVTIRKLDPALLARIGEATLLQDLRLDAAPPSGRTRNGLALVDSTHRELAWLTWRPHVVGPLLLARTTPLLAGYLVFYCLVLAIGLLAIREAIHVSRELAASEARAQHNALHDPLLGLPNRTHVMQRLTSMLAQRRDDGEQVVLAFFDLDRFKAINETVGHHVGDDILVQVVDRLRQTLRPGDVLGRLASDEFVVVRMGDGRATADELGRALMQLFTEPFRVFGQTVNVTASCGLSWAPEQAPDAKTVLRNADIALFEAKAKGRARYRRFTAEMDATIRWRRDMEAELRRAIACNHLAMAYQPIVNLADGSIASFEALVRWTHPERGEISPGTFVPLAEQAGLMPELGDWVLRRVFADSHDFGTAEISINLSPLQIVARDFIATLRRLLAEERVDPSRFTFEITEGVLLDRSDRVLGLLGELQDMGFRIALDDFGTGYSSLAYLRTFQFDRIKVDRSFVQGIESDVDAQSILRAIVALGRTLRMKVVAEGVETLLQQQLVHAAGCQYVQGFLYWRALTPEQVVSLLATDRVQTYRLAV
ncbi:putative bifunctional diguanylate cyclase/phosphodiesterase [Novosphingobium piscinae]|uniref:Bifunctional diguanylate cyclase/phosphodiesterase n=1 Tax=Novosphingobium piscinae TaxID=1507448 RepID=A0A7X1FXU4_9SPHN|nr:bifunctional diguanylate cyclase/phosphodiesterase [Novosphingobium piscinae]MBC2668297.1 bifunctional diguanylate cyclase/phosphodiesterase [Novosphingobium piscinae]